MEILDTLAMLLVDSRFIAWQAKEAFSRAEVFPLIGSFAEIESSSRSSQLSAFSSRLAFFYSSSKKVL
jgi:hypothetical protein